MPEATWLDVERDTFDAYFDRKPFFVKHRLSEHALFSNERLLELARRLPAEQVEYNAGDLPVDVRPELTPRNGLSVAETIRRISECRSWMVLKHVEQDPEYRALLDACLDQIREHSERVAPGMHARAGFVFLSSPGAVTPYHMDPEHNFLLQIRGSKTIHMWDPADRFVVSERDIEAYHATSAHRNLRYRDEYRSTAFVLPLEPGVGLQFPVTAPHWVKNGPEVSVSFSITFSSRTSIRRATLYNVNARLRRLGLEPTPVGRVPLLDEAKMSAYETLSRLRRTVRRLPLAK